MSLADIRREFAENRGLTVTKDGTTRTMIDDDGVTIPCKCGKFETAKRGEAFNKCWVVQMYYALLRKSVKNAETVCMAEEDFIHELQVLHAE